MYKKSVLIAVALVSFVDVLDAKKVWVVNLTEKKIVTYAAFSYLDPQVGSFMVGVALGNRAAKIEDKEILVEFFDVKPWSKTKGKNVEHRFKLVELEIDGKGINVKDLFSHKDLEPYWGDKTLIVTDERMWLEATSPHASVYLKKKNGEKKIGNW